MAKSHEQGRRADPTSDLLENRSFQEVALAIRSRFEQIVHAWERLVRQTLPAADHLTLGQLRDDLPHALSQLAEAVESANAADTRALLRDTTQHGVTRFHQGYNVRELLIEYRLLRRAILDQVKAVLGRHLTEAEATSLHMGIDAIMQQGVVAFVDHQKERLQSVTQAEARYLSFLSHDLRGSLNSISLTLELLQTRLVELPGFEEDVADLRSAQKNILSTVEGMQRLLETERLRKEAAEPKIGAVSLHGLAQDVVREFEAAAHKKGVGLTVNVPPDVVIQSDRAWLLRVLQNLVSNAVKYSSSGTVRVGAEVRRNGHGDKCLLTVSDEGPGIAPEQLEHIFEAFRRGHTHGQAGVGLGLAIASKAAELLGAKLSVRSELGRGSVFCLELPTVP